VVCNGLVEVLGGPALNIQDWESNCFHCRVPVMRLIQGLLSVLLSHTHHLDWNIRGFI